MTAEANTQTFHPHKELLEARRWAPEFFDQWAEWLETTKMTQCREHMTEGQDTACCLHVLECYSRNKGIWFSTDSGTPTGMAPIDDYDFIPTVIPGIKDLPEDLALSSTTEHSILYAASLNDTHGLTFPQIAQLLRGNSVEITA